MIAVSGFAKSELNELTNRSSQVFDRQHSKRILHHRLTTYRAIPDPETTIAEWLAGPAKVTRICMNGQTAKSRDRCRESRIYELGAV